MNKNLRFAAVAVALSISAAQAQVTQTNLTTGAYFNTGAGWTGGGADWVGQQSWTGTDAGATAVQVVTGLTPSGAGNNSGTLGVVIDALPLNSATPYVEKTFTPMDQNFFENINVSFTAEWGILDFGALEDDTFTFELRNTAGNASALTFLMDPNAALPTYNYNVSSIGSASVNQFDGRWAGYDAIEDEYVNIYRLQVDISGSSYSGSYQLLDPTTRAVLFNGTLNGGTLAGAFSASDIDSLRLGWDLASNDPNAPGDLGIMINEFTITSTGDAIPEPGTWAVGALLVSGAAASIYRRRKARSEKLEV